MRISFLAIVIVLLWYPIGLLIVGIDNSFDPKPKTYTDWKVERMYCYGLAMLGPLNFVILVALGIYFLLRESYRHIHLRDFFPRMTKLTDWIVAGFRKPPSPPATEDDGTPDFPTASP